MKAAVDLTIIKTEKVDIELFPSPGERRVPSAPRSAQPRPLLAAEVWRGGEAYPRWRGGHRAPCGVFWGCLVQGSTERTPKTQRSGAARALPAAQGELTFRALL